MQSNIKQDLKLIHGVRSWDFLTLVDFAFLVCDLHELGEGRTVSHSFVYKQLWKLWPSLHKLGSKHLQK